MVTESNFQVRLTARPEGVPTRQHWEMISTYLGIQQPGKRTGSDKLPFALGHSSAHTGVHRFRLLQPIRKRGR